MAASSSAQCEGTQKVERRRKVRPLSEMPMRSQRVSEVQESHLIRDAESVVEILPFSGPIREKKVAKPSPSSASLSRRFGFYYWSVECPQCQEVDKFLSEHGIPTPAKTERAASTLGPAETLALIRGARKLIVVHSAKSTSKLAVTAEVSDAVLLKLAVDEATNTLKTPCLQVGGTVVIGFAPIVLKKSLFFGNSSPPTKKTSRIKRISRGASSSLIAPFKSMQAPKHTENDLNQEEHQSQLRTTPRLKRQRNSHGSPISPTKVAPWQIGSQLIYPKDSPRLQL